MTLCFYLSVSYNICACCFGISTEVLNYLHLYDDFDKCKCFILIICLSVCRGGMTLGQGVVGALYDTVCVVWQLRRLRVGID